MFGSWVLIAWVAFATAGSLLFAFALARRTGEDDLPPFTFAMATAGAAASVADGGTAPPASVPEAVEDVPDPEALIPRWRRPSLQAARQSHWAEEGMRVPQRFPAGAPAGDRRIVAYRLVLVSDRPDDRDAVELGRVDRGDEVELLRRDKGFALVRAPDGLEGWIDASTLDEPPG